MKKLMIAAAIVCAAAVSEAATFTWGADDTQYMPTSWTGKKTGDNQASGNTSTKKIANWVNGGMDFTAAVFLSTDGTTWNPSKAELELDTTNSKIGGVEEFDNSLFVKPAEGTKDIYYKIVITGTYADEDGTWTATGTIGGTTEDYITLTSMSADELSTGTVGSWNISFVGADPGPVPEPTSGLLLLLGVAGLALRRRRA